jgi:hypothetical protein
MAQASSYFHSLATRLKFISSFRESSKTAVGCIITVNSTALWEGTPAHIEMPLVAHMANISYPHVSTLLYIAFRSIFWSASSVIYQCMRRSQLRPIENMATARATTTKTMTISVFVIPLESIRLSKHVATDSEVLLIYTELQERTPPQI